MRTSIFIAFRRVADDVPLRSLLVLLLAINLVFPVLAEDPSRQADSYEEWLKTAKRFDPSSCRPKLVVRADNDIDLDFDAGDVGGGAPLPDTVTTRISYIAKDVVDRQDWEIYANDTCENFMPKVFRIAITSNLDLYAVMFREPYDDSLRLLIHDKSKNVLSSTPLEVSYRARDVPGMDLRPPYIAFVDLRQDGSRQIVVEHPGFLTTFYFSAEYRYYDIGPNLQFMQVFARETRMSDSQDGWDTVFVRDVTPLSKGRIKLTTTMGQKDGTGSLKEIGDVTFESRGLGDPFWITQRHLKNHKYDNALVTIAAGNRVDENNFVAGR